MFEKILLPIDLGEPEAYRAAIETVGGMAKAFGAEVRLVTVVEPLPGYVITNMPEDVTARGAEETAADLDKVAKEAGAAAGGMATTAVRRGAVYHEVLQEAEEWGADLIAMASHRPEMSTYLLGSNAARIVRHAHCSVLVLRGGV